MRYSSFEMQSPLPHAELQSNQISRRRPTNFVVALTLIVICLSSTSNYFAYHEPSAIATDFQEYYGLNTQEFGALFTIYSAPNVVLVFFSGMLIDKYGAVSCALLFNSVMLLGCTVCALAPNRGTMSSRSTLLCLLVGRFFLGVGGESICACTSTMLSKWFTKSGHLNTAMAINQSTVQLCGSAAAFALLPRIDSVYVSQWVTVGICGVSLAASAIYGLLEKRYSQYLESMNSSLEKVSYNSELGAESSSVRGSAQTMMQTLQSFPLIFWLIMVQEGLLTGPILYTFTAFGPLYLQENFEATRDARAAGNATSLLYVAIVAAPLTGAAIDRLGHRSLIQFAAAAVVPLVFTALAFQLLQPAVCMLALGLAYSVAESNALAMVSLVVPGSSQGAAFGLYACAVSFALLLEPWSVGALHERTGSFATSIWIFTAITALGALLAMVVFVYDRAHPRWLAGEAE